MLSDPGFDGLSVSRETRDRLAIYEALLRKWSKAINLVSPKTLSDLRNRHLRDSAQLLPLAPIHARRWLDLGSGAGFPGAVVALIAAEQRPSLRVTCVESDQRKAAFLCSVSRETDVLFDVEAARIEAIAPKAADVVSARALAPLTRLLDYAAPHLVPGGVCLFPKGANVDQEVAEAQKRWRCDVERITSKTHPDGVILRIGALALA